jgi:hypothetical protein
MYMIVLMYRSSNYLVDGYFRFVARFVESLGLQTKRLNARKLRHFCIHKARNLFCKVKEGF